MMIRASTRLASARRRFRDAVVRHRLLPKWIIGSSAEQAAEKGEEQKTAKRDLEGAVAEGGETVEPILDAFGAYSTCAMFTVYNVRLAAS